MRLILGRIAVRFFALAAISVCAAAWIGTYHRPFGISRVFDDACTLESTRGAIILSRLYDDSFSAYVATSRVASPTPVWVLFTSYCQIDDRVAMADMAWAPRHPFGFGFGIDTRVPSSPTDQVWSLDENGNAVKTTADAIQFPAPPLPPHKHRQFVLTIPWWFLFSSAAIAHYWRFTRRGANARAFLSIRLQRAVKAAVRRRTNQPMLWTGPRRVARFVLSMYNARWRVA